ncbi:MAG: efflux RND transporter periplasmic adaptor subunit, partial [Alphaproteobacteria bacterium]|nr:efflux RND transporter periplasmic adaptor subunit [Alphaproteobacteria bacterium]
VGDGGRVTHVLVEPGDWVKAGQVLATIERSVQVAQDAASAASITAAQANAQIAQSNYSRAEALLSRGFISKADVESKKATLDAALAQVNVARAQLSKSRALTGRLEIRAPAAGLVLSRNVEEGQVVGPASGVLFRIARDGEMELKAQLAEADLAQLRVGDVAQVTPTGATHPLTGRVWQVAPIIDPQTRQGVGRIALAYDPSLRPGGFASTRLDMGAISAPLLPQSAVQTATGTGHDGSYVYIIDGDNQVVRRDVKIANVSDQGIAIASGLDGSERVVATAAPFLNLGQKVRPVMAHQAQS